MPSEYHKWVARDVKREEPRVLTEKEKRANWWHYHWRYVALCVVAVAFVGWIVYDVIDSKNNQPDCQIAYIGSVMLPNDTILALEEQLAPLIGDVDGNGEVIVQIRQYTVDPNSDTYSSNDPKQQMAMVTHLSVNENALFILEDPAAFQECFQLLLLSDGTQPEDRPDSTEPLWYSWAACPVLAELPLGDYRVPLSGDEDDITGSNQELLSKLYIGRGAVHNHSEDEVNAYTEIWERMIEGVKSAP